MQVKWLRNALKNLDEEAEYLAKDNPQAARELVNKLYLAGKLLEENPAAGRTGRIPGTRELIVSGTDYLLPYRVKPRPQQVEILRVFHTSRKLPKKW